MNPIYEEQERELERSVLCEEILSCSRNELYFSMRFLDVALGSLKFSRDHQMHPAGTDGGNLFYNPDELIERYRKGRVRVNRLFLHMAVHCLFAHLWQKKQRDEAYWNLACDITAEYIIDGLSQKCVYMRKTALRREWYRKLEAEIGVVTAQKVYRYLHTLRLPDQALRGLRAEFCTDDHRDWQNDRKSQPNQEQQKRWEDIRDRMQTEMETFSREASDESRSLLEQVQIENRSRYDYKEFLRKFSVLKEEMKVDLDSFDYIFYNYGMDLYGNMPLIEPLETKEEQKVEDFILVIDTSMSCKGELVQKFLEETYGVLNESESFHRKINVHILQCDDRVQQDTTITNEKEMKRYLEHFAVKGQGGTDFRPAFAYVEELQAKRAFERLKGLIYFTDGYGTFPVKKPAYETAFVFLKDHYQDVDVPPWAIKLIIDPKEEETGNYEY